MANRGLPAPTVTALEQDEVEYYYLVEIGISVPIYEALCPRSIDAIASDFISHEFMPNGLITSIPDIVETLKMKPSTMPLKMSGASEALHVLMLTENYKNAPVIVYQHEVSTAVTTPIFKGYLDTYKSTDNKKNRTSTIIWTVANHWTNWEAIEGRFMSMEYQQSIWNNDFGMEFASRVESDGNPVWGFANRVVANRQLDNPQVEQWITVDGEYRIDESIKKKLPLVYGEHPVKGHKIFWDYSGVYNEFYWVVYALAEGECEAVTDIRFNDGQDSITDPKYTGFVDWWFHSGTDSQLADANMLATTFLFNVWTSLHTLNGVAYVAMRFKENPALWEAGIDPLFDFKAKKLFDPRTGLTTFSKNTSLVLYDYSTSSRYGKGLAGSELAGIISGANEADLLKVSNIDGVPIEVKQFEFSGIINLDEPIIDNVEKILFAMRGFLPWTNNLYELIIAKEGETGDYFIDETNTYGGLEVSDSKIKDLANFVTYDYANPEIYGQMEQVISESTAYLAEDNGRVLKQSYTNKFENNYYRAANRANTLLKESREQVGISLKLNKIDGLRLECGRIVNVSDTMRGWVDKKCRIESWALHPNLQKKGIISLGLKEYESVVYNWATLPTTGITSNTTYRNPLDVLPVTGLILTAGTAELIKGADGTIISRIKVTFTAPNDANIRGYNIYGQSILDQKAKVGDLIGRLNTTFYISPVADGLVYVVSVEAYNALAVSEQVQDTVIALGKTEEPTTPTSLTTGSVDENVVNLFWTDVSLTDIDLDYYEVFAAYSNDRNFATLVGSPKGNTLNHSTSLSLGIAYYWVRAIDTSGNPSGYFPSSQTGGYPAIPNGVTTIAEWEAITGKPIDDEIYNTVSFRNGFEVLGLPSWRVPTGNTLTQETDSQSGAYAGLFKSTLTAPTSTGMTATSNIEIPAIAALAFAGKRIRVTVYAKKPATGASASFKIAYSTNGDGNSGWSSPFVAPDNADPFATFGFIYDVPDNNLGTNEDFLGIWGDDSGTDLGVLIDNVVIDIIGNIAQIAGTDNIIQTFYLLVAPTVALDNVDTGDYWINTSTNELWRAFNNTDPIIWGSVQDHEILQALNEAGDAQATADGKIVSFAQNGIPIATAIGDIWMDTDDGNRVYRAAVAGASTVGAGAWEEYQDDAITTALITAINASGAADAAQATADGKIFMWKQPSIPTSDGEGDIWMDTDAGNLMYRAAAAGVSTIGAGAWEEVQDADIAIAYTQAVSASFEAATAQGTADRKVVTFVQDPIPTSESIGDLWLDIGDNNKMYRAASANANQIIAGEWEVYAQEAADWTKVFGIGKPADNADVTNYTDYRVSNSDLADSVLTIKNPQGATYSGAGTVYGAIVIVLPTTWSNTMMKFIIDVYIFGMGGAFRLSVGGYNNSSVNDWNNTFAQLSGNKSANNKVRFGHNGTNCVIVIGDTTDTWLYPKINVSDFQAGHSNFDFFKWDDNWDIILATNLVGFTFTPNAEISDALLDSKSILNQGVMATDDGLINQDLMENEAATVSRSVTPADVYIPNSTNYTRVARTPVMNPYGRPVLVTINYRADGPSIFNITHTTSVQVFQLNGVIGSSTQYQASIAVVDPIAITGNTYWDLNVAGNSNALNIRDISVTVSALKR